MAFMAFIATIAAGALGGFVTTTDAHTKIFFICAFIGLMVSASFSFRACRPRDIYLIGNNPIEWAQDLAQKKPFKTSMAEQVVHYQNHIELNRKTMRSRNRNLELASAALLVTIVVCAAAAVVLWS